MTANGWDVGHLEARVRELTVPINGQYPRPWMTNFDFRSCPRVFVVGYNQASTFEPLQVGAHDDYLDALFNRNGRSIRSLYDAVRASRGPSPTRENLDRLNQCLALHGVHDVLETNVVCYSSMMSAELTNAAHPGGKRRGTDIFHALLDEIRPTVLIAHGSKTRSTLVQLLKVELGDLPGRSEDSVASATVSVADRPGLQVFAVPSLAPPAWNKWSSWAPAYLDRVCAAVAAVVHA